jgi:hypothetical protein
MIIVHIPIQFAILLVGSNWGIAGVAWAQLVSMVIAVSVRIVVAAKAIEVPVRSQARSMVPGVVAAVGVLVLALPTTLVLDPGPVSLVLGTLAGGVGAVVMVRAFAPATFHEVAAMVLGVVRRAR